MIYTRTAAGEAGNRFDSEEPRGQQSGNNARKSWDDPRPVHDDQLPGEFELSARVLWILTRDHSPHPK